MWDEFKGEFKGEFKSEFKSGVMIDFSAPGRRSQTIAIGEVTKKMKGEKDRIVLEKVKLQWQ